MLVHAKQVVTRRAVIIDILLEALDDVGPREPEVLHLFHNFVIDSQIVVVFVQLLVEGLHCLLSALSLANEILVKYIIW